MSIEAMNWAFAQRELKPATKLVLVFLANCHNQHTRRCDPSQQTLAEECCISRSTVNVHLNELERLGLIRRVQRSDKATRKQLSSLYLLGCDFQEEAAAQPVSEIRTRVGAEEGSVSGNQTRENKGSVSENRTRKNKGKTAAVSEIRTRKSPRAVSGKRAIPCPDFDQSRVRTVGHEPEYNPKGTLRAPAWARVHARGPGFFTADERAEAQDIARHIRRGGSIRPEAVSGRVRACLRTEAHLPEPELRAHGLIEERG
ncbi:helix-turn-helix domain-containing protein [Pseudooceanicola sp. CBS1P-1]|nr:MULTISPECIES: helix-turn-helix domain-containing protein [Pseudooceanicola]MBT9386959.1 helix-turn-helix domain-containing protein [Pseudooceanicola endophyticus]